MKIVNIPLSAMLRGRWCVCGRCVGVFVCVCVCLCTGKRTYAQENRCTHAQIHTNT